MIQVPARTRNQEDELVWLLQCRQERGFTLLYQQYAASMYGIALRVVRCPAIAQDVVQETFVKVWRNIEAYQPGRGRLFTWLLNLVRNTALDHWRSRRRLGYLQLEEYLDSTTQLDNRVGNSRLAYLLAVDHIGISTLMGGLTSEQQLVVEYLYFRGYTHSEVARTLHLPLGTVKTRVRSALIQLRKLTANPGAPG